MKINLKMIFDSKIPEAKRKINDAEEKALKNTIVDIAADSIKGSPILTGNNRRSIKYEVKGMSGAVYSTSGYGGYLDIVADLVLWALLPLGFAIADPQNALSAVVLLASFIASGTTFLGYAILAAKTGEETEARGEKSFFHLGGLTEGTETILFFVIVLTWPNLFSILALVFAFLAALTALGRVLEARRSFGT